MPHFGELLPRRTPWNSCRIGWDSSRIRRRSRCCGVTHGGCCFTAGEAVAAGETKYDVTAVAMIALLKYGTGVPFKRLERLQGQLGMPWRPPRNGN